MVPGVTVDIIRPSQYIWSLPHNIFVLFYAHYQYLAWFCIYVSCIICVGQKRYMALLLCDVIYKNDMAYAQQIYTLYSDKGKTG